MIFRCSIRMDNAAFDGREPAELAHCLEELVMKFRHRAEFDARLGPIVDTNGNTVGSWAVEWDEGSKVERIVV